MIALSPRSFLAPRPLTLLASLLTVASCARPANTAATAPPSAGGVVIEAEQNEPRPYFHDFGEVRFGEVVEHTFRLHNTESVPVTLLDAQGACACSSVRRIATRARDGTVIEGDPRKKDGMLVLDPDGVAEMTVRVDSGKATPNQNKLEVMRVRTSSERTPYLTFEVRLFPRQLFQATPRVLDLQDVPQSAGESGFVDVVTGRRGEPARIVGVRKGGERVRAELEELFSLDEPLWKLHVTVPENEPLGLLRDRIELATTDAEGQGDGGTLVIEVWGRIVPDVVIYPQQISLGALRQDEERTVEAELRALAPGMRVKIVEAHTEGGSAAKIPVRFEAIHPDELGRSARWSLTIEATSGLPAGRIDAELVVRLDDAQHPEVRATLVGFVR